MKTYTDNPDFQPTATRLSTGALNELFDSRPIVCVDALIVDRENHRILLPTRTATSAKGLWFIGGMLTRDLEPANALVNIFERETGLKVDISRFSFLAVNRFVWESGGSSQLDSGRVDLNFCYSLDLKPEEIEQINSNLDNSEYEVKAGLTSFNREDLIKQIKSESPAKQVLVDYYDLVFSK